jgi:glycosyltransferase involved in cell wall biosynthesis
MTQENIVIDCEQTTQNPLVSVIVLTLNSEKYVHRCLMSIKQQTLCDFEVLVVDAGSTDKTYDIVSDFDNRFKWMELPNSDMGAARNYGISASHGKYLCFLDSDDFYLPSKLETQVNYLEMNPDTDVLYCSTWVFRTDKTSRIGIKKIIFYPENLQQYLDGFNHNLNTMCIRRSLWDNGFAFGEGDRGRYGEEWRLQLMMIQRGVKMEFQPDPLVVVEVRPDSHTAWSIQWKMKQQAMYEVQRVGAILNPSQLSTVNISRTIDRWKYKLSIALLLDDRKEEALETAKSISNPFSAYRAYALVLIFLLVSARLRRKLISLIWVWQQNRSFEWYSMPEIVKSNLITT